MKNTKAAGNAAEREVRKHYRDRGWIAIKVSDSAICDVVAMRVCSGFWCDALMIEVKASAKSAFADFPPAERRALLDVAARAGATPMLVWKKPRHGLVFIPASEWPPTPSADDLGTEVDHDDDHVPGQMDVFDVLAEAEKEAPPSSVLNPVLYDALND